MKGSVHCLAFVLVVVTLLAAVGWISVMAGRVDPVPFAGAFVAVSLVACFWIAALADECDDAQKRAKEWAQIVDTRNETISGLHQAIYEVKADREELQKRLDSVQPKESGGTT